jgi:amidase
VLADAGAKVSAVSIPEHHHVDQALALYTEGGHAVFQTGFFGAFARTYYPRALIVAINQLWDHHADLLSPFTKLSHIVAEYSRQNYHGAVYAKAQNVRKSFIRAYDAALSEVDVLILPTCISVAPKYERGPDRTKALETELSALLPTSDARELSELSVMQLAVRNTMQFNYTGHPALSVPCGKIDGLPVAFQLVGRFFEDGRLLRAAAAYQHLVDWDAIIGVAPRP